MFVDPGTATIQSRYQSRPSPGAVNAVHVVPPLLLLYGVPDPSEDGATPASRLPAESKVSAVRQTALPAGSGLPVPPVKAVQVTPPSVDL
jgi:hypothetical protein